MPDSSNTSRERDQSRICVDNVEDWNKVKQNFTEAMMTMLDAKVGPADKDVLVAHLMQVRLPPGLASALNQNFFHSLTVERSYV